MLPRLPMTGRKSRSSSRCLKDASVLLGLLLGLVLLQSPVSTRLGGRVLHASPLRGPSCPTTVNCCEKPGSTCLNKTQQHFTRLNPKELTRHSGTNLCSDTLDARMSNERISQQETRRSISQSSIDPGTVAPHNLIETSGRLYSRCKQAGTALQPETAWY